MSASWQIRLKDQGGDLVAVMDAYEGFSFTRRVNGRGSYALRLNGDHPAADLFELDGQLEFWRRDIDYGIDWYIEFEALHRNERWYVTTEDKFILESSGLGYNDLLARTIIYAAAGSAQASKEGAAETVAKAFVSEQMVTRLAVSGFSVQADGANGNAVRLARAYRNLLEVVQEIAAIGYGDFQVVGTGPATFQFRWYDGQLGIDRTATQIFSLPRGNMISPTLTLTRSEEVNAALVGGQGEGAARNVQVRTDATRIAESPWNRHEQFMNLTNEPQTTGLQDKGDQVLEEGRPKYGLTFDVLQTPASVYGYHYELGDLVTARFAGYEATKKIVAASITVDAGGESVSVELEDVWEAPTS